MFFWHLISDFCSQNSGMRNQTLSGIFFFVGITVTIACLLWNSTLSDSFPYGQELQSDISGSKRVFWQKTATVMVLRATYTPTGVTEQNVSWYSCQKNTQTVHTIRRDGQAKRTVKLDKILGKKIRQLSFYSNSTWCHSFILSKIITLFSVTFRQTWTRRDAIHWKFYLFPVLVDIRTVWQIQITAIEYQNIFIEKKNFFQSIFIAYNDTHFSYYILFLFERNTVEIVN